MLVVGVFEDLWSGKGIVSGQRVVMKLGGTEDVVRLVDEPFELRAGQDDFWVAGEIRQDVGFASLAIL